ncbi:MAG: toll/interleukin-1 receptor domain-containing protein [Parvularculaceae bacterium]
MGRLAPATAERFRASAALARALEADGASARLSPVFRDREDFPVAGSLNAAIQAALADSEYQIVLCSPNAAKSKWVNDEVKLFHKLHGPGRVFLVIVGGEPFASKIPGREAAECFPPALRFVLDENGEPTGEAAEPLAADAREEGDGKRYAMLKVAAGMLGVGLDDLVRRDAQRRARQAWTITGASMAGMAATIALSVFAVNKSNEATRLRGEAEDLIEFMLTDLKDRLEPVGRLDVLESVVDRAMDYYAGLDLKSLDDDALARRAKAMMQLGTIDYRRNHLTEAQKAYETAEAATAELLRRAPNNPDRIFDHAQNVFDVGGAAMRRYDRTTPEQQNNEYLRLAQRLMEIDGDNPRSQLELAYATNNLGNVRSEAGLYGEAVPFYEKSIEARARLLAANPDDDKLRRAYAYAISWYALTLLRLGEYRPAIDQLHKQLGVYGALAEIRSQDFLTLDAVVTAQRRLADAYSLVGDAEAAADANTKAEITAKALVERDAQNANWSINAAHIERESSIRCFTAGDIKAARAAADRSVAIVEGVLTDDAPQWYRTALGQSLAWRIELSADDAAASDIEQLDRLIAGAIESDVKDNAGFIANASRTLAQFARKRGDAQKARAYLDRAIRALEPVLDRIPAATKIDVAGLYLDAGAAEKSAPLFETLDALGTRRPDYLAIRQEYLKIAAK